MIGAGNRLLASPGATYTYDNEGNVTGKTDSSGTWAYAYDNQNQLAGATQTSATALLLTQATYVYDALGNMASKSVYTQASGLTTVTKFAADLSGQTWADLTSGGSLTTRYVLGEGADARLARVDGSGVFWILADRQGSVRNVTNSSGSVVATAAYDGYGNFTVNSNATLLGFYGYVGFEFDSATGFWKGNIAGRWYNPTTGNWIEEDPIRQDGGLTRLDQYVGNDPTNKVDPSGTELLASKYAADDLLAYLKGEPGFLEVAFGKGPSLRTIRIIRLVSDRYAFDYEDAAEVRKAYTDTASPLAKTALTALLSTKVHLEAFWQPTERATPGAVLDQGRYYKLSIALTSLSDMDKFIINKSYTSGGPYTIPKAVMSIVGEPTVTVHPLY